MIDDPRGEECIGHVEIYRNARGEIGCHVVSYGGGMSTDTVPCRFGTFGALLAHVADLVATAMKSRRGRG